LIEWLVGVGVVAFGLIAFTFGVQHLEIVDHGLEAKMADPILEGEPLTVAGD
jgi:hypothetical protein